MGFFASQYFVYTEVLESFQLQVLRVLAYLNFSLVGLYILYLIMILFTNNVIRFKVLNRVKVSSAF
jgi:hypothetical protein